MNIELESSNLNSTENLAGWHARYKALQKKHPHLAPAVFFVLGVSFDILMVGRIDELFTILQQALYLVILSVFISLELLDRGRQKNLSGWLDKIWSYREEVIHFFLGTLLSIYNIFYFKSASFGSTFCFLFFIWALLLANEFHQVRALGVRLRFTLLTLCFASYFCYVIPILWGSIGLVQFFVSVLVTAATIFLIYWILRKFVLDKMILIRELLIPAGGVLLLFVLLYMLAVIPPAPLSIQFIGIYHKVERVGEHYRLTYERPWWRFWEHGDQTFYYRPGDRVHVFARIFSPARFQGKIFVRWQHFEERSREWHSWDAIPIQIVGGREEGFRGVAIKENFTEGRWRVRLETEDRREIGRAHLEIIRDHQDTERPFRSELQ